MCTGPVTTHIKLTITATETNTREFNGFWNGTRQAAGFTKDDSQTRKGADMQSRPVGRGVCGSQKGPPDGIVKGLK